MSVTRLRPATKPLRQTISGAGTVALSRSLTSGVYRVTSDTTQSLSATQLLLVSASGYKVGIALRGGLGYVSLPFSASSVQLTTGTFPMLLEFEQVTTYTQTAGPTGVSFDWTSPAGNSVGTLTFTAPAGATSVGIHWRDGTFTDLATTTSPVANITLPTAPTFDNAYEFIVVAKDSNGVWGLPTTASPIYPYAVITTSQTYTTPSWSTQADLWLVAGGGGGGSAASAIYRAGGGGGAGGYKTHTGVATSGNITVTIGAGGAAGTAGGNRGSQGGATSFGALSVTGGGGGGGSLSAQRSGGSGGSGGGGGGETSTVGAAGTGTSGEGFNGGTVGASPYGQAAGGGGATAVGANPGGGGGPGAAGGQGVTVYGTLYAVGGGGGGYNNVTTGAGTLGARGANAGAGGGGGGTGEPVQLASPSAGLSGLVIVKARA